jgi:mono/diheme cytochrome c family protein
MDRKTKLFILALGVVLIAAFNVKSGVEASQHDSHAHSHAPASAKKLKNPLQATEENINAGKTLYASKCATCHGEDGKAKTNVAEAMKVKPADLTTLHERTDGEIYWVITNGIPKSGMPALKTKVSNEDRWKITLYVKHLMGEHPHG